MINRHKILLVPSQWKQKAAVWGVCLVAFWLAACGGGDATTTTRSLKVSLVAGAGGAAAQALTVQVIDNAGQPVTNASVSLEGNMNHAGMAPVSSNAVRDDADGSADGQYQVPFTFDMLGDWIITVTVQQADGSTVHQDFQATVNEQGIVVMDVSK